MMNALKTEISGWRSADRLVEAVTAAGDVTDLPDAILLALKEAREKGREETKADISAVKKEVDSVLRFRSDKPISLVSPRGRMTFKAYEDRVSFVGAKNELQVPNADIEQILILDGIGNDSAGKVYFMLCLSKPAKYGTQIVPNVLIQTLPSEELRVVNAATGSAEASGQASISLARTLSLLGVDASRFIGPDPGIFKAASGKNSCRASYAKGGIKEGQLFFLRTGVCFAPTPPTFVRTRDILCVELPRHGSASSTFDIILHMRSRQSHEFLQLGAEEAAAVARWAQVAKVRVGVPPESDEDDEGAMKEEEGPAGEEGEGEGEEGSSYDEEEDSDFDPQREEGEEEEARNGDSGAESSGSGSSAEVVSEEGVGRADLRAAEEKEISSKRRKLKHEEGGAGPSAGHAGGAGPSNAGHQDAPVPYGGTAVSAGGEQSGGGSSDDDDAFKAE